VIDRQCSPHAQRFAHQYCPFHAPKVLGVDRMCRSIPQPGKKLPSTFIHAVIPFYLR
jgi:hypothetical protein